MKKDGGVAVLEKDARESCESLLDLLADHGVFVVPGGEVEAWLPELAVTGHGPPWLIEVFEKMGTNPKEDGYVEPPGDARFSGAADSQQGGTKRQSEDVWQFMDRIGTWLRDENRRGMPD